MANLGVTASRGETRLVSLFEIGEIYFGDTNTGGALGARQKIVEVRNLYLEHALSSQLTARGGMISTSSDPRAFIFSDHVGSVQANLRTDNAETLLWYGDSSKNRVGTATARDAYFGASMTAELSLLGKGSIYGLYRTLAGEEFAVGTPGAYTATRGDSAQYWIGATFDLTSEGPWTTQATLIGNWAKTGLGAVEHSQSAYLADFRLGYHWIHARTKFVLEGLMTPGAVSTDSGTGKPIVNARKNFISPIGTSYLLTVATSDGVDDAPGTPKESTIAALGQEEGLRMAVFTATHQATDDLSFFARGGLIRSAVNGSRGSTRIGEEIDLGLAYQLSPETMLQADWGQFMPGPFFANRSPAHLLAARMKFTL